MLKRMKSKLGALRPELRNLRRRVAAAAAKPEPRKELLAALDDVGRGLRAGDRDAATLHVDRFVLAIRRHMGTEVSLRAALQLADTAIMDIKRSVADPGQIYVEAEEFVRQFVRIEAYAANNVGIVRPRREPNAGMTIRRLRQMISSYKLPPDETRKLLAAIDQIAALAAEATEDSLYDREFQRRAFSVLRALSSQLQQFEGSLISTRQRFSVLGTVIFASPAVCLFGFSWPAQIAAGVIALGVILFLYLTGDDAVDDALESIAKFLDQSSQSNRRPGADTIRRVLSNAKAGLSAEQQARLKQALQEILDDSRNEVQRAILLRMLEIYDLVD